MVAMRAIHINSQQIPRNMSTPSIIGSKSIPTLGNNCFYPTLIYSKGGFKINIDIYILHRNPRCLDADNGYLGFDFLHP